MGGASATSWKGGKKHKTKSEKEWEEIGTKVEGKVLREMKKWTDEPGAAADEGDGTATADDTREARDAEWEEIGRKIEAKIKRKVRKWAEED